MKVNISLPATLKDIPLRDYQKFLKISDENKDAEDPEFLNMKMLEIFCNVSLKEAYEMKLTDFNFALEHLSKLFQQHTPLVQRFTLEDQKGVQREFGFVPKLEDMTLGEYVDVDTNITEWENMHKGMAVLYRPVKFQKNNMYLIEDYTADEYFHEVMKDMPLSIALGSLLFFYRLGKELSIYLVDYLKEEVTQGQSHLQKALPINGDGISQFTQSLEGISSSLKRLKNFRYTKR